MESSATLVKTPIGIFTWREAHKNLETNGIKTDKETFIPLTAEIEVYEPNPENPRYLRKARNKTMKEVLDDINKMLPYYVSDIEEVWDYFHISCRISQQCDVPFPEYRCIVVYVITGTSEGHYVHVDIINKEEKRENIFLGKTFSGFNKAWDVARALALILEV